MCSSDQTILVQVGSVSAISSATLRRRRDPSIPTSPPVDGSAFVPSHPGPPVSAPSPFIVYSSVTTHQSGTLVSLSPESHIDLLLCAALRCTAQTGEEVKRLGLGWRWERPSAASSYTAVWLPKLVLSVSATA